MGKFTTPKTGVARGLIGVRGRHKSQPPWVCAGMSKPNIPEDAPKILMQGIHVDLTPAMQDVIREKFDVLLQHNPWIIRINVRLHSDQKMGTTRHYTATGQIEIGGPDIIGSAEGTEAYTVLDDLVASLSRQLKKRQGLRKDKRNHPHEVELDAPIPKTE